jgi:hypothetical protein
MEITNLGQADGLPPVDWAAVAEKSDLHRRRPAKLSSLTAPPEPPAEVPKTQGAGQADVAGNPDQH